MNKFGWEIKALRERNWSGFDLAKCNGDKDIDLVFFIILAELRL